MWDGFWAVDVAPSPKSQAQAVGSLTLVSAKLTASGDGPERGVAEKAAIGVCSSTVTRSVIVEVSEPLVFETVRLTVYVPAFA